MIQRRSGKNYLCYVLKGSAPTPTQFRNPQNTLLTSYVFCSALEMYFIPSIRLLAKSGMDNTAENSFVFSLPRCVRFNWQSASLVIWKRAPFQINTLQGSLTLPYWLHCFAVSWSGKFISRCTYPNSIHPVTYCISVYKEQYRFARPELRAPL